MAGNEWRVPEWVWAGLLVWAGSGLAWADDRCYEWRILAAPPEKLDLVKAELRTDGRRLLERYQVELIAVLEPLENPQGHLHLVMAYADRAGVEAADAKLGRDWEYQAAEARLREAGALPTLVERRLLRLVDFSPIFKVEARESRIFEMRTYTAAENRLAALNARFRNHTFGLFEAHGMRNLVYWNLWPGEPGAEQTLVYLLAHDSVEAAQASFTAFREDPAWVEARRSSEKEAGGSLTVPGGVKSVYLRGLDFSPLR